MTKIKIPHNNEHTTGKKVIPDSLFSWQAKSMRLLYNKNFDSQTRMLKISDGIKSNESCFDARTE